MSLDFFHNERMLHNWLLRPIDVTIFFISVREGRTTYSAPQVAPPPLFNKLIQIYCLLIYNKKSPHRERTLDEGGFRHCAGVMNQLMIQSFGSLRTALRLSLIPHRLKSASFLVMPRYSPNGGVCQREPFSKPTGLTNQSLKEFP